MRNSIEIEIEKEGLVTMKKLNEFQRLPGARCRNRNRKFLRRNRRPERGSEGSSALHKPLD
jgi:hypothetical protein